MCFYIDKKNSGRKTAKEDIICWKWLERWSGNKKYHSLFKFYEYEKDVITPLIKIKRKKNVNFNGDKVYVINEGYHSYKHNYQKSDWGKSFKFIIPKGTRYYENDDEYVSEQIMLVEENQ